MRCVRIYNGEKNCPNCGWDIPEPGLAEAVIGTIKCSECDHSMAIDQDARREVLQSYDQRLHLLDNQ